MCGAPRLTPEGGEESCSPHIWLSKFLKRETDLKRFPRMRRGRKLHKYGQKVKSLIFLSHAYGG